MKIGLSVPVNEQTLPVTEIARAVEERGVESLWVGEHTHCPVATVHPNTRDGRLPEVYKHFADPFITLAAAAATTSSIRLGTCIALPAEHNPLEMAKQVATIDLLSGGRFEFGVGYGWNPLELINNGVDPKRRRQVFGEKVSAMKALWTQEVASFAGEFVSFSESWSWPKPVQNPNPPILIGAVLGPRTLRDVVALADGWLPIRGLAEERLASSIVEIRCALEAAGRDPNAFDFSLNSPEGSMGGKASVERFRALMPTAHDLERFAAMGIGRLILSVWTEDRSLMYASLDLVAQLIEDIS